MLTPDQSRARMARLVASNGFRSAPGDDPAAAVSLSLAQN
jgi:hypothetical protein